MPPRRGNLCNLLNRAHLDRVAPRARGEGKEIDQAWGPKGGRIRSTTRTMGLAGGEHWPKNMGVWNWKIRGALPEIILLLVWLNLLLIFLVSLSLVLFASSESGVPFIRSWCTPADLYWPERTFLAWLRTSLAFASIGIAVTQLFRLNTTISEREGYTPANPDNTYHLRQVGKPLGATFLGIAILVLLIGARRYFESQVCRRTWVDIVGAFIYVC